MRRASRLRPVANCLSFGNEDAGDEGDAEGDDDSLDDEEGVVAPADDGEGDGNAPEIDFAQTRWEPCGLRGGGGNPGGDCGDEARDPGAVGEVRLAKFAGKEGLFAGDETE